MFGASLLFTWSRAEMYYPRRRFGGISRAWACCACLFCTVLLALLVIAVVHNQPETPAPTEALASVHEMVAQNKHHAVSAVHAVAAAAAVGAAAHGVAGHRANEKHGTNLHLKQKRDEPHADEQSNEPHADEKPASRGQEKQNASAQHFWHNKKPKDVADKPKKN